MRKGVKAHLVKPPVSLPLLTFDSLTWKCRLALVFLKLKDILKLQLRPLMAWPKTECTECFWAPVSSDVVVCLKQCSENVTFNHDGNDCCSNQNYTITVFVVEYTYSIYILNCWLYLHFIHLFYLLKCCFDATLYKNNSL